MINKQLRELFGSFPQKKNETIDDEFIKRLIIVMEKYSNEAIIHVTSMSTGLQRKYKSRSSISMATIIEALEKYEGDRKDALRYRAMGAVRPSAPRPPIDNFANCRVFSDAPQYPAMMERASKCTDPRYYQYGPNWVRVPFGWVK